MCSQYGIENKVNEQTFLSAGRINEKTVVLDVNYSAKVWSDTRKNGMFWILHVSISNFDCASMTSSRTRRWLTWFFDGFNSCPEAAIFNPCSRWRRWLPAPVFSNGYVSVGLFSAYSGQTASDSTQCLPSLNSNPIGRLKGAFYFFVFGLKNFGPPQKMPVGFMFYLATPIGGLPWPRVKHDADLQLHVDHTSRES
jgi:hypothetical protein